jgi:hypothetical protein
MEIANWFPSLTTLTAVAAVGWLFRKWIGTRLAESIGFEFDEKIESLKAEFRLKEEHLRADLRAREAEIATLRASSIAALSSRQIAIDKRRLEAIDQLWGAVISLNSARGVASHMALLNFELIAERAVSDQNIRDFLEIIGGNFDIKKDLSSTEATKVRPFVTPIAWAIYVAILGLIANGAIRWHIAKSGLGHKDFSNQDALSKMLKAALPEFSSFIEEHGTSNFQFFIEQLESKLLNEFQAMMNGLDSSKAGLDQAAEILKYSSELTNKARDVAEPDIPPGIAS